MLIGEVAERSGITARMLRHYDRIGVVSPSERTASGYRRYTEDNVRRLFHVEGLRALGLSLQQVAEVLDGPDFTPERLMAQLAEQTRERIARDRELLRTLQHIAASDPVDCSDVLHTVGLVHGLAATSPSARQRLTLNLPDNRDALLLADAALRETNPTVAGTLYWALAQTGDTAVPLLRDNLDSADGERRRRAVEALEKINTSRATSALAEARGHTDPVIDRRATIAAGTQGDAGATTALVAYIMAGHDVVDATRALQVLASHPPTAAPVHAAIEKALLPADPEQALRLIDLLAQMTGPVSREQLAELTTHPNHQVARAARYVLEAGDPLAP